MTFSESEPGLPESSQDEYEAGYQAVLAAMSMTRCIQQEFVQSQALIKQDRTPVTIADYVAQAVISRILARRTPHIPLVAEEDARALRQPENFHLVQTILHYLNAAEKSWDSGQLCTVIDRGNGAASGRFWALDPVDGTKGFLRNEQYAIALALIDEGRVQLGFLGCPRLIRNGRHVSSSGFLFAAAAGRGASMFNLTRGRTRPIAVSGRQAPRLIRALESYESSHSDKLTQLKILKRLGVQLPPLALDGQVKYGLVASGSAELYLRLPYPQTPGHREKIWDHAAGSLIVSEAGGRVSDMNGKTLDFSCGQTLAANRGIVASNSLLHDRVLQAIGRS